MPVFLLYAGREWNGQIHDKLPFPYLKKGDMLLVTPMDVCFIEIQEHGI